MTVKTENEIGELDERMLALVYGLLEEDEAAALREVFGNEVPVTAIKSYVGNLSAACGAVEAVASLLALEHQRIPPTLNFQTPDPACPVRIVSGDPLASQHTTAVLLNGTTAGQAAALVLA